MKNINPNLYPAPAQMNSDKFSKQVTITAGTEQFVGFDVPTKAKVLVKGIGYTWYTSNEFRIVTGNTKFPKRTDQLGSASIPHIWDNPYEAKQGDQVGVYIKNGDAVDHTYDVVIYYMSDVQLNLESTGGELIISTGGGSSGGSVVVYNSSLTTAANVTAKGLGVDPYTPTTLLAGTKTAGATASALASTTNVEDKITIQVDPAASNGVLIGNATAQPIALNAGDSMDIRIDDIAKIYVKRNGAADVTINYMGS